jgi:hypothetical protein
MAQQMTGDVEKSKRDQEAGGGGGVLLFSEVALRQINDTLRSIIHLVLSPQRNFPSAVGAAKLAYKNTRDPFATCALFES